MVQSFIVLLERVYTCTTQIKEEKKNAEFEWASQTLILDNLTVVRIGLAQLG